METRQPAIKWASLRIFLYLISFIAALITADIISVHLSKFILGLGPEEKLGRIMFDPDNPFIMISTGIIAFLILMGITALFRKTIDRKSILSMGFKLKNHLKDLVFGSTIGGLLLITGFIILVALSFVQVQSIKPNAAYLLTYLITLSFAAMNEEIAFRGYILNNLMEKGNRYVALLISSLLFALLHGLNPNITLISFINLILAGLLLGIYYIHRKNLWFPFGLHVAWNFFQGPVLGFQVSGLEIKSMTQLVDKGPDWLTGGNFGFEGSALLTVMMIILICILHVAYREKEPKKETSADISLNDNTDIQSDSV